MRRCRRARRPAPGRSTGPRHTRNSSARWRARTARWSAAPPASESRSFRFRLIHYIVISMIGRLTVKIHLTNYYLPNLFLQFILLIIHILLISSVFYLYIERPFMSRKLMDKLMKP